MRMTLQQIRALASAPGAAAVSLGLLSLLIVSCSSVPRGPCDPNPHEGIGSICGFANPEDVEVIPAAGILLVSEMRHGGSGGALAALPLNLDAQKTAKPRRLWPPETPTTQTDATAPLGDPDCPKPSDNLFSPHGIASRNTDTPCTVRVAVVRHGEREAIDLFDLVGKGDKATLTWRGCIPLPPDMTANDVQFAPDGEILATFYQPPGWRYTLAMAFGIDTGHVIAWKEGRWRDVGGTEASGPNGVMVLQKDNVFYSASGSGRVFRVPLAGLAGGETAPSVKIGGNPDNLALSPRGTILAATHSSGLALAFCRFGPSPCRSGWTIFEIDPATMEKTELLHHDGSVVGAVSSVSEHEGRFYLGAIFDDRIGVWQRSNTR